MKVEIAPKEIAEILVHENDSFEEIAQEFCELHNLDNKIAPILVEKMKINIQAEDQGSVASCASPLRK